MGKVRLLDSMQTV